MSNLGRKLAKISALHLGLLGTLPPFLYGFAYSEIGMNVFVWETKKESLSPVSQTVIASNDKVLSPEEMKKNEIEITRQSEQAKESKQKAKSVVKNSNIVRMTTTASFSQKETAQTNESSPPTTAHPTPYQETKIETEEGEKTSDDTQRSLRAESPSVTKKTRTQHQKKAQSKGKKKAVTAPVQEAGEIKMSAPTNDDPYADFVINTSSSGGNKVKPVTETTAPKNEVREVKAKFVEDQVLTLGKTYSVLLQIKEPVSIGGVKIPKNTMVTTSSRSSGDRMLFDIYEIEIKGHAYPIKGQVLGHDHQPGIFIESMDESVAEATDQAYDLANQATQNLSINTPIGGIRLPSIRNKSKKEVLVTKDMIFKIKLNYIH